MNYYQFINLPSSGDGYRLLDLIRETDANFFLKKVLVQISSNVISLMVAACSSHELFSFSDHSCLPPSSPLIMVAMENMNILTKLSMQLSVGKPWPGYPRETDPIT